MLISYSENGESKQREANADEAAYIKSVQDDAAAIKELENAEIKSMATAKAALLTKIGITADEAALLLT